MPPTQKLKKRLLTARADVPDFRDFMYEPALLNLKASLAPPGNLFIRDQGTEGACTGFGLAAVIDKLLADMRAELDPKKRYEYSCAAQKLIHEGSGTLIATHRAYIDAKAKNVKGFPRVPIATFGGMEWPEFIWIDA